MIFELFFITLFTEICAISIIAGIYTLRDAMDASAHCGPEKGIVCDFLSVGEGKPTQEERGPAVLLLKAC